MSSDEDSFTAEMDILIPVVPTWSGKYGEIADEETHERVKAANPDHVYQELGSGWCGPALISRIFKKAGVEMNQEQIAHTTLSDGKPFYDPSWGTSHARLEEFLLMYFHSCGVEAGASVERIAEFVGEDKEVILNVRSMDDLGEDGHYVAVKNINLDTETVIISDPTNGIREDGLHGVYPLSFYKLNNEWWDYATPEDEKNKKMTRKVLIWVDPLSIKADMIKSLR